MNNENNIEIIATKEKESYFENSNYQGGIPLPINYKWGQKYYNQKVACIVLSLYPRNKIAMKMISETYARYCDGLYWILDHSNNSFNKDSHKNANEMLYSVGNFIYITKYGDIKYIYI